MQDSVLKKIFADPEMIELLVRRRCPEVAEEIDFSTLRGQPTELVSDQFDRRVPDMLFLADRRGNGRVLIHLEFQATVDPGMAVRGMVYVGLAVQNLREKHPELRRPGALVVVSMVLYHGKRRWTAPLNVEDVVPGFTKQELVQPEAVDPDRVEAEHAPEIVLGMLVPEQGDIDLSRRYDALIRALDQGAQQRLFRRLVPMLYPVLNSAYEQVSLKEDSEMPTMIEAFKAARRADRAVARREGRLEANAQLIVRLAARRFGSETAERVSRLLAGVRDPERMERVADALVECADGREFLADVRPLLESGQVLTAGP